MSHAQNIGRVLHFLASQPDKGYNYQEIASKTGVSWSAVRGIITGLKHEGLVERFFQKERRRIGNGSFHKLKIAYFAAREWPMLPPWWE